MKKKASQAIRFYRERHGWSQGKLAKTLGYRSPQIVSNVERGVCGVPARWLKPIKKKFGAEAAVTIATAMTHDYAEKIMRKIG